MSNAATLTSMQGWLRDHSELLALSFVSSEPIKHNVTKGKSRERQILDTLHELLPARVSVEKDVIIVDATDAQSPSFDGALVDRTFWPQIFTIDGTPVAMIESVFAAVEVKSSLGKSDLVDIFQKSSTLRTMEFNVGDSPMRRPFVTAFAYKCPNANLSFFDFATYFARAPESSPSLICILNASLFSLADIVSGKTVPTVFPPCVPVLFESLGYHGDPDC
jgi:hypothetical protein